MKIAIMQPYVFPYLGYFQLYNSVDLFISLEDVNYIRGGWINRNKIMVEGSPTYITFPIRDVSQNRTITQQYIYWDGIWNKKLLKKIRYAYGKEKHFDDIYPHIEILFSRHGPDSVSSFAMTCLTYIGDQLGITTKTRWSLGYSKENKGQERLIDICKSEKADMYINAIGGKELYNPDDFYLEGIELRFIKRADNENDLSIIDILMRRGWEETSELVKQYELVE